MRYKLLPRPDYLAIVRKIKTLLHASRDGLRNRDINTDVTDFDISNDYYCEAFGMLHALALLKYGQMGANNDNIYVRSHEKGIALRALFDNLQAQVLIEEGYDKESRNQPRKGRCDWCYLRYRHDAHRGWGDPSIETCLTDRSSLMRKLGVKLQQDDAKDDYKKEFHHSIVGKLLSDYPNGLSCGLIDHVSDEMKARYEKLLIESHVLILEKTPIHGI